MSKAAAFKARYPERFHDGCMLLAGSMILQATRDYPVKENWRGKQLPLRTGLQNCDMRRRIILDTEMCFECKGRGIGLTNKLENKQIDLLLEQAILSAGQFPFMIIEQKDV